MGALLSLGWLWSRLQGNPHGRTGGRAIVPLPLLSPERGFVHLLCPSEGQHTPGLVMATLALGLQGMSGMSMCWQQALGDSGVTFARLGSQYPCSVPVLPVWVPVPCCGVGEQDRLLVLLGALLGQAPGASRKVQEDQASTCGSPHAAISPDLSLPPLLPGAVVLQGLSNATTPESGTGSAEGDSQTSTVN